MFITASLYEVIKDVYFYSPNALAISSISLFSILF